MHRCPCSTRALEIFIKDFAGLGVRQQRARQFYEKHRSFSTRSQPLRQQEGTSVLKSVARSGRREENGKLRGDGGGFSADMSAEEMDRKWCEEEDGGVEAEVEMGGKDNAKLDDGETAVAPGTLSDTASATLPSGQPPTPTSNTEPTTTAASKAQGRMMRKLRRIEDGKYKTSAVAFKIEGSSSEEGSAEADQDQENQLEQVLRKIDQLSGPSILKAQAKRKERLVLKSEEKRKERRIAKDTKVHEDIKRAQEEVEARERERKKNMEPWQSYKATLDKKFGDQGWQPRKRLSPDSLEGIRALHTSDPGTYTTPLLAQHFEISPESIRRILKSKWQPSEDERVKRSERWEKRGLRKWEEMAEQGQKPPKRWRAMGVKNPNLERKKKWEVRSVGEEGAVGVPGKERKKDRWRDRPVGEGYTETRGSGTRSAMSFADRIV